MKLLFSTLFIFIFGFTSAQNSPGTLERLSGISNNGMNYYNIEGIQLYSYAIDLDFSKQNILANFNDLREEQLATSDETLAFKNYHVADQHKDSLGFISYFSTYFIESENNKIIAISFASVDKSEKELERELVHLIRNNAIPKSVYHKMTTDTVNFAGRQLLLDFPCQWMDVNSLQCPKCGQINWSLHPTLTSAQDVLDNFAATTEMNKFGKLVTDTSIQVIFEGKETTARKIVFDVSERVTELNLSEGTKTLTAYYVVAPSGTNYISCIMSHWNNDQLNQNGLPPLIDKIMQLKD
ncbi:hypothetical protein [Sphingobacterium hungaricum]